MSDLLFRLMPGITYVRERLAEQKWDNISDPACKATVALPNCIGVDYHVHRKSIAHYLNARIALVDGEWMFEKEGRDAVLVLLATGICKKTVAQWLYKYAGYQRKSFILYKCWTAT
jgi:hypothetical protein